MPVKGLMPALLEVGKIKIGMKGEEREKQGGGTYRLPVKLDHFRITTNERDEDGDFIVDEALTNSLVALANDGVDPSAKVDKSGNLVRIPVRLLYDDIDLNFPTRYASYVGGKCSCSGDGEKAITRDGRETPCPCPRLDQGYKEPDKCKVNGTLSCIVAGAESIGGCHKLRTTSKNTAMSILGSLAVIKAATGGILAFLPLSLVVQPKTTTIPGEGGTTTVYIVSVVYSGTISKLQRQALEMAQSKAAYRLNMEGIESEARLMLEQTTTSEEEEKDIQEEFYPAAGGEASSDTKVDTVADTKTADEAPPPEDAPPPVVEEKEDQTVDLTEELAKDAVIEVEKTDVDKTDEKKADATVDAEKKKAPESLPDPAKIVLKTLPKEVLVEIHAIAALKKELGINDKAVWANLLKEYGVVSAKQMTIFQLKKFKGELEAKRPS